MPCASSRTVSALTGFGGCFTTPLPAGERCTIHHLVFGIAGLLVSGDLATGFDPQGRWARNLLAGLFGVSMALTIDEFALWLNLQDVYWSKQGRESVDAAIATTAAAFMAFDGRDLLTAMARDSARLGRALTGRR